MLGIVIVILLFLEMSSFLFFRGTAQGPVSISIQINHSVFHCVQLISNCICLCYEQDCVGKYGAVVMES